MFSPKSTLNRSFSSPDICRSVDENRCQGIPVVRRVVVEQYFNTNLSPISYRQISCEQIYAPSKYSTEFPINGNIFDNTVMQNGLYQSKLDSKSYSKSSQSIVECKDTPMEIDVMSKSGDIRDDLENTVSSCKLDSKNTFNTIVKKGNRSRCIKNLRTNQMENVTDIGFDNITRNVLKKRSKLVEEAFQENTSVIKHAIPIKTIKKSTYLRTTIKVICLLLILYIAFVIYYGDFFIFVNSDLQLINIKRDLNALVHNQSGPVTMIIRSLENRERWSNKIKIIGLIGTTGVGKTFIGNIIKSHFYKPLVHDLYGQDLGKSEKQKAIIKAINPCCCNLLIIDDLYHQDSESMFLFVESLPKDSFILILSIFNIQYNDDELNSFIDYKSVKKIQEHFDKSKTYHELIVFNEFENETAQQYLRAVLVSKGIEVHKHDKIIGKLLENHNVKIHGLKGLFPKVLIELQNLKRDSFD